MSSAITPQTPQTLAAMFSRLSASFPPGTSIAAFCESALDSPGGQKNTHTLLSTVQHALLPFFTTAAVLPLRATCKEACAAVTAHAWTDIHTVVPSRGLATWRRCFPNVRSAAAEIVRDKDFKHLKGLQVLWAQHGTFSGAGLVHLHGIKELWMHGSRGFEGRHLVHLRGIHTLDISSSNVTDADLKHLSGIHTLRMWKCVDITGEGFVHLGGIHTLLMSECSSVTDDALVHLRGIKELDISETNLTGAGFRFLHGIQGLNMSQCMEIEDDALRHLAGIQYLDISYCDGITGAGFVHLSGLGELQIWACPPNLYHAAKEAGLPLCNLAQPKRRRRRGGRGGRGRRRAKKESL